MKAVFRGDKVENQIMLIPETEQEESFLQSVDYQLCGNTTQVNFISRTNIIFLRLEKK